jgi:hypothetical protein
MKNPIIEELWKVKDELARECEYDLNKLAELLRKEQKEGKHKVVDFSKSQARNSAAQT